MEHEVRQQQAGVCAFPLYFLGREWTQNHNIWKTELSQAHTMDSFKFLKDS